MCGGEEGAEVVLFAVPVMLMVVYVSQLIEMNLFVSMTNNESGRQRRKDSNSDSMMLF